MKTEEQIKEKQIELQGELMNAIEAKRTFESAFERKPTEQENKIMLHNIAILEAQNDVIDWMLS
jgi:hypothetical protein